MKKQADQAGKSKRKSKPFPIVAIGASAGGLQAVTELLKNLSPGTDMAYVYVQHLDPSHESRLSEILSGITSMKVLEATHLLPIEKNHLYVIPPNKDLFILDGVLTLNPRKPKPSVHMPIDKFFTSLAEKQRDGSIGIVLSGTANDGTLGLKAIKTAGGITFAQDDSAQFQSMPKSAIAGGGVDMVLSPKEIAAELERLSKKANLLQTGEKEEPVIDDHDLTLIFQLLKKGTAVDFTHYKTNTIRRRIIRRMLLHKLETLKDYAQYLKQHTHELSVLYQDLLINVTSFFRDADAMEYLKKSLLQRIIKSKLVSEPIRIWVPACSTGEEAYSLAIILMEIMGDRASNNNIQIFATDLSELSIAKARLGLYSRNELQDISPKRLQRFFTKVDNSYRIVKTIRDMCVFAPHNIFKDPPFSRLDFISCCNLMIYLDNILQKKIMATFHYTLNNNGYLMLGKSETIGNSAQLFSQIEKKYKIYSKKKDAAAKAIFDMNYRLPDIEKTENLPAPHSPSKESGMATDLEKVVDRIMLSKYIPASVLVNQELEILQFRGSTGLFLEPSPGKASLNLLKMARPELAFELRNIIHKVSKSGQEIKKGGLEIKNKGVIHRVSIEVTPIKTEGEERLFLVIFEEMPTAAVTEAKTSFSKDKLVKKLQGELETVREDMRSIIEEQEASNEELQSANEEIVSSNEELQSINEELETSKEEVESANEELTTINAELQVRNEQLAESYEYAEAFFNIIREAVLVLDRDLRVKSANRAFYRTFKVNEEETEGMFIYELGNGQWNIPKLRHLLEEIIPQNSQFNDYEVNHNFPLIGEKTMLLNAREILQKTRRQQLIFLAIEDITGYREAQKIVAEREAWLRSIADNAPVMMWVAGIDKSINFYNRTWLEFKGHELEYEKRSGWGEGIHPADIEATRNVFNKSFEEKKPFSIEYRLKRYDGEYRWVLDIGKPRFSPEGAFTGFIGTCNEIHDKKMFYNELEEKVKKRTQDLQEINEELGRSNNELQQFAYVASHDLQEPLRKIISFSDRLIRYKDSLPEQAVNYIDKIVDSSQRMTRLIDDLLNFSRTSRSGRKFIKTDLNAILKGVLTDFELIISQKKAGIKSDHLPSIEAIPVQMEQLFHNLLSNALKFTSPNVPPVINISVSKPVREEIDLYGNLDKSLSYIRLIFADNGIGFDPAYANQIFTIFQRLHEKQDFPGTGIGLALCRKIVNNHRGEIFAFSIEGRGASFHVILPEEQP